MKRTASALLALLLILMFTATAWAFTDTAGLNSTEQAALTALSDKGVVVGYPDGTFRPAATVTRAEFAKMLCLYAGQSEFVSAASSFTDVFPANWFYGWVSRAVEQGWITGYPDGSFKPQNMVTQQEIAAMLVRLSGVDTASFIWPDDYIKAAQAAGIFQNIVFVSAAPASRILTIQMLYNALPAQVAPQPEKTATVRGIVMELKDGSVTLCDGLGVSKTYTVSGNLLPDKLIAGSYVELTVAGGAVVSVAESILPKKGADFWDVGLDGRSAVIDNTTYDLTNADIFAAYYTPSRPYSSDTFQSGGPINRDILALGGRLAADMAVVVDSSGRNLIAAYLVNPSILVSGGRLDVVDGGYSSSKGSGIYFLGRDAGLAMDSSLSMPASGQLIHYTLKNGEINSWDLLLDLANDEIYPTTEALKNASDSDPYAWVGSNGQPDQEPDSIDHAKPLVQDIGSGRRGLQLGTDKVSYWLADGCLIYEVDGNNKISQGSTSSIVKGQNVIALVNRNGEICYLFCFVD